MKSETPLDYAVFQLSPNRSRCELFVSSYGNTEKLASGLVKPFVTHLKVAEEQVAQAAQSIKLEVKRCNNEESWFTKGTLERFVRFVSTPEVLELVSTFDVEMSQLETARRIYSQGVEDQLSGALVGDGTGATAAADATKRELLRAIDVRLEAVRHDLTTASARASAAGFNPETVFELQFFADQFGARRLDEACTQFISVWQRRPDLINSWKPSVDNQVVRSSWGSDMSIDDLTEDPIGPYNITVPHQPLPQNRQLPSTVKDQQQQKQPNHTTTNKEHHNLDQSLPSTCQQTKSSIQLHENNNQREIAAEKEKTEEGQGLTELPQSQPARRLSVQDRINLFENKQKENKTSGSGGKPIVEKPVLRRLSSDVSLSASASTPTGASGGLEKTVLRRWSGVSDMSIDLGNDKKDNCTDSPLCTPTSSSISQAQSNVIPGLSEDYKDPKEQKGSNDTLGSIKIETNSGFNRVGDSGTNELWNQGGGYVGNEEKVELKGKTTLKNQGSLEAVQISSFTDGGEQVGVGDQGVLQEKLKGSLVGEEKSGGFKDQVGLGGKSRGFPNRGGIGGERNHAASQIQIGTSITDGEGWNRVQDAQGRDQPVALPRLRGSQRHSRSLSGQFEGGVGIKPREAQYKGTEGDRLAPQLQRRPLTEEIDEVRVRELASLGKEPVKAEDSGIQRMKFQKPVSVGPEQIKKSHGRREERGPSYGNNNLVFTGKKFLDGQESFDAIPTSAIEQVQRVRQSKGNQERNDELKIKANELEKLFAEHKLRAPGEQSSSERRSKPADMQIEQEVSSQYRKATAVEGFPAELPEKAAVIEPTASSSNLTFFSTPPTMKMVDHQFYGDTLRQSFSDDLRGKFYEKYMQKRDEKLREEWVAKGAEKEARLKAMNDSLERSRAEMKTKFSDGQDSLSSARRRAEKLRSFNIRSSVKREQHPISLVRGEEDEDLSEFSDQKYYGQDRLLNKTPVGDTAPRSSQTKKLLSNRNLSSATPRTTAVPLPRLTAKISSSSSGRRTTQSENPLAQSVPNFSDFRKENTKPSGVSKVTMRSQVRNNARSRSTIEEVPLVKDEKPRRSQSLRKSSSGPLEFATDMSALNSNVAVLAPLKFDKEQGEHSLNDKYLKDVESKPFLRKGNGIGPGAGANIAKLKALVASENLKDEAEYDEMAFEAADSMDMSNNDEEEVETMNIEECADIDNGKPRLSQDSNKLGSSGSENGDSLKSLSQVDPALVAELPAPVPSAFDSVGCLQDSPGESPVSWNSRMHHPFSYPHETFDIDPSVDSPIGSPASWNSHSLVQTEADAARMRKKWGSAQKPILVANASHNQPRKDVTKGFKRLLKFGRKNRGTDNLVDWISATTSEGDDDTEDGRDPANRSSDDLRKSRMGFPQGHPSDDSFNESEMFTEQFQALNSSIPAPPANFKLREDHMSGSSIKAPRSFFSLSTFRSKGSDSKPR
ncbi:hypothetical protein CFOL_v3_04931 [Cephalotus follicularis]|uniref:Uncharacterized protein n=1 Tax=Cephalotus follicularis TaxID=3775 RepID=A0A1Q3B0K1_CEPFO|nr:hypothetical protein CFOL_v3_04931 [Cephalotus follicularis]